jgi:hypothetical protein
MSTTYEINDRNEVIPYTSGRRCNDTRAWRDATDLELQQREDIIRLEGELEAMTAKRDALDDARTELSFWKTHQEINARLCEMMADTQRMDWLEMHASTIDARCNVAGNIERYTIDATRKSIDQEIAINQEIARNAKEENHE